MGAERLNGGRRGGAMREERWLNTGGDVAQFGRRCGSVWEERWLSLGGDVAQFRRGGDS
jgi:hypothetical protein